MLLNFSYSYVILSRLLIFKTSKLYFGVEYIEVKRDPTLVLWIVVFSD